MEEYGLKYSVQLTWIVLMIILLVIHKLRYKDLREVHILKSVFWPVVIIIYIIFGVWYVLYGRKQEQ